MAKHIKSLIQVSKCICCILRGIGYEDLSVVVNQLFFLFPIMNVMMRLVSVLAFSHVGVLWFCQLSNLCLFVSPGNSVSRRSIYSCWIHGRGADKPYCGLLHELRCFWCCRGVCHITWHQSNVWWGASTQLDCITFYDKRILQKSSGSLVTSSGNWHTDLFGCSCIFCGYLVSSFGFSFGTNSAFSDF